ncbi:hypothetical protein B0H11DRAFT_2285950 [Mycena galericulata]|nr:hypothetical protein B0H11DRAFT_2285950 [Mycena galericulata]
MPGALTRPIDPEEANLGKVEQVWAHFQPWLEARGYMLRPRYRPGWVLPPSDSPEYMETRLSSGESEVLDATRISDGAQVVLKIVKTESPDTLISGFLTTEPSAEACSLPILDLLPMDEKPELAFMVMPRMRNCLKPRFETVGEVMEFIQQGLLFLHSRNIAHRDISPIATSDGEHILHPYKPGDDSYLHIIKSRTQARSVKYYFIDFGLAVRFPSLETREFVTGICGRHREYVTEISETVPYDPFKVDIHLAGQMLWIDFLLEYDGLDCLITFVHKLRHNDPAQRPDAAEALELFQHQVMSNMDANALAQAITPDYLIKGNR